MLFNDIKKEVGAGCYQPRQNRFRKFEIKNMEQI